MRHKYSFFTVLFSITLGTSHIALAENNESSGSQQATNQRVQQEARREQLTTPVKDIKSEDVNFDSHLKIPDEKPCYFIDSIEIVKDENIPGWLPFRDITKQVSGKCVGKTGLQAIYNAIQNRIISHGYITTRVIFPQQDLKSRHLKVKLISGLIESIKIKGDNAPRIHVINNFPDREGHLLDLRGLEQGLENMQRAPGSTANIRLVPGKTVGSTDVEITRSQPKIWRLGAWMDDSGSKYTGRYQAGVAAYLDNMTSLNDSFYVSYGGGLQNEMGKRSDNGSIYYAVPWGYNLLEFYGSRNRYTQTLTSNNYHYQYSGDERYISAELSRVVYRSATQKTTLSGQLQKRDSHYHLNDVEVEVQKRDTTAWEISLDHKYSFTRGEINGGISYQRAVSWLGDTPDAEEISGMADKEARVIRLKLNATLPFQLWGNNMSYEPHFLQQMTPDKLTEPDKFSIGNRWTVRGFDGENNLIADKGWYLRNDINLNLPSLGAQPYIGLDYGEVKGSVNDYWSGKHLLGTVAGVRGVKWHTGYDVFIGAPLLKPDGFETSEVVSGFTLQWQY